MSSVRILIDMDGVLADWHGGILSGLKERGINPATALDESRWDLGANDGVRRVIRRIQSEPGFYRNLKPIEGGIEALQHLATIEDVDVRICTTPDDTNPTCASDKIKWVRHHLGDEWTKRIILTHDKTLIRGDILVDDKPEITGDKEPEWTQILFDQPYNRHVVGMGTVFGWEHWAEMLEDALADLRFSKANA